MSKSVMWECPCGNVVPLAPCRVPGRKVCSRHCPARADMLFGQAGGKAVQAARLKRVMFTYGCSEENARWFIKGSRRCAQSLSKKFSRARSRRHKVKSSGPRIGSAAWEKKQ